MPTARVTRHVSTEDREAMSELMPKASPGWVDRDLMSFAGGMASGLFLLFIVVSGIVAGAGHLLDIPAAAGWMHLAGPYGLVGSLTRGAGFAVHARICERHGIAQIRQSLSGDPVHATTYDIVAVKSYQEPEHGGIVTVAWGDCDRHFGKRARRKRSGAAE